MPITTTIDRGRKRVVALVEAVFSTDEIIKAINSSVEHPDFETGFDILSDHRSVEKFIEPEQVHETAAHLQHLGELLGGSRWAVVVGNQDEQYGMMRMLSVFAEQARVELRIFRELRAASEWLDGAGS